MNKVIAKTFELATTKVRVYPSTYEKLLRLARERRTTMAQIIHEMLAR